MGVDISSDYASLSSELDQLASQPDLIIQGGAMGADRLARRWAEHHSIESLILNIPVPVIYLSQDVDVDFDGDISLYSVIDGQQRLSAIHDFFMSRA